MYIICVSITRIPHGIGDLSRREGVIVVTMSWFFLALLAPFIYAIVNLIDDSLMRFIYKSPYLAAAVSSIFGALPLLSLFVADWSPISWSFASMMIIAGMLTSFYYFFYFKALEKEAPSVIVAMFSLIPATLPIFAYFLLDERLSAVQLAGFLVVMLASLGLALTDVRKLQFSKAIFAVLAVVLLVDIISLLTKYVYDRAVFYPAFMCFSAGIGVGGVYFLFAAIKRKTKDDLSALRGRLKKLLPILLTVELFGVAAEFTTNLAVSRGPVSLVNVLEGTQPIYVLAIALLLFPFAPKLFREASEGGLAKKFTLMGVIIVGLFIIGSASL